MPPAMTLNLTTSLLSHLATMRGKKCGIGILSRRKTGLNAPPILWAKISCTALIAPESHRLANDVRLCAARRYLDDFNKSSSCRAFTRTRNQTARSRRKQDSDGNSKRNGLYAVTLPSAMPTNSFRPVSGLASGLEDLSGSPSHVKTQWLCDPPELAYRCGGSAGIVL